MVQQLRLRGKGPQNAPQLGTEMRQSLQAGAQQTKPNEGLPKETQLQTRQIEDFQTWIATALDSKNKAEQELDAAKKRLEDSEEHFKSQYLTCQLLQDRVDAVEAELQRCQAQTSTLLQERDELALERENLHHSHSDVTRRVTDLDYRLADREVAVKLQAVTLEELMMKALSLVKQRDVKSSSQHPRMCSIAEIPTGADSLLLKGLAIVPKAKNPGRPARQSSLRKGKGSDGYYGLGGDGDWVDEPEVCIL